MSTLLTKVVWYGANGTGIGVEITDIKGVTIRKGLDASSNVVNFTVRNPIESFDGTYYRHKWTDFTTGQVLIRKGDVVDIYVKYVDDNSDFTDSDLLTTADVTETVYNRTANSSSITFKCIDKTFNLLNKIWSQSFTASSNINAPEIIKNLIRQVSNASESQSFIAFENQANGVTGTKYTDGTGLFTIDARLVSEGGNIQDTRPNSGGVYPDVSYGQATKPIYEWIEELSKQQYTNTDAEIADDDLKCPLKHLYYIDKDSSFHWFHPDSTVDYEIDESECQEIKLNDSVFDVLNHIEFNSGKDLRNLDIIGSFYDTTSSEASLKSKFKAFSEIAVRLKQGEVDEGNITINEDGTTNYLTTSGTTAWGESFSTQSEYEDIFYTRGIYLGEIRASAITRKRGSPRLRGTIRIKGRNFIQGELIKLTARSLSIINQPLRILNVTHQVSKISWTTTISVEEDEKVK